MGFKEAIVSVFSNYVNFEGRARRSEYWYFVLLNLIVGVVLGIIGLKAVSGIYSLAVLLPSLAVTWRRLHDTGQSGLCILIGLIPLVGEIILIVWCATDSQPGDNRYGPNPKADYYM